MPTFLSLEAHQGTIISYVTAIWRPQWDLQLTVTAKKCFAFHSLSKFKRVHLILSSSPTCSARPSWGWSRAAARTWNSQPVHRKSRWIKFNSRITEVWEQNRIFYESEHLFVLRVQSLIIITSLQGLPLVWPKLEVTNFWNKTKKTFCDFYSGKEQNN